jgi:hypothetical protein
VKWIEVVTNKFEQWVTEITVINSNKKELLHWQLLKKKNIVLELSLMERDDMCTHVKS